MFGYQKDLLIEYVAKEFGEANVVDILKAYPLEGVNGLRRMLGEIYPEYFCKAYLPDQFEREFADYSRTIVHQLKQTIESNSREKKAIIAPREHGKSTFCSFAMPTWATCYQKKKFIFFISSNNDIASNFLGKIKKALQTKAIEQDFGKFRNKREHAWNNDEIFAKGTWVACSGWKSGLRGLNKDTRPDLIILDDLEDKMTIESESLFKKLELCFREEIGRLGQYNTDFFYIGTLLSEDSLLAKIENDPSWKTTKLKRVISFPKNDSLWDRWREIYRNIKDENRFENAYNFYIENKMAMIEGTKVLWPNKVPPDKTKYPGAYYNVMLDRETFGEDAFWKEDQNEPRNSDDHKFKNIVYWDKWPEKLDKLKLAVDPSEGKNDYSAYVVGGELNGGYFIKDARLSRDDPYKIMETVCAFIKSYPQIEEIIFESNLFKDLLKSELIKKLCNENLYRSVLYQWEQVNKHIRIMKMEPDITGGNILFNKINVNFNEQVKSYSKTTKHDDAPDALQSLIKQLKKPNFYIK
jgi:predicted phage terminase large subunit-like protein